MKVWITRQNAGSVTSGGLERLDVWFQKPVWVEAKYFFDLPFCGPESGFHSSEQWEARDSSSITAPLSFGKLFGYLDSEDPEKNNFAKYVWGELVKHFKNAPFREWMELEKRGEVKVQDFFLEIDLSLSIRETKSAV